MSNHHNTFNDTNKNCSEDENISNYNSSQPSIISVRSFVFFFFFVSRGIDIDENEFINMLLLLVLLLPLLLLESVNIITLLSALAYVFN